MKVQKALILFVLLLLPTTLFAEAKQQIYYSALKNNGAFQYSNLDPTFSTVKASYGVRADYLQEFGPDLWWGGSYARLWGTGSDSGYGTMMQGEIYEGLFEFFAGDREKMASKASFWEKLYLRVGGRLGMYKWLVQHKDPSRMTELQIAPVYFSSGYTWAPYAAIGLGELGSIEYTHRFHLSGAADMSHVNNRYLAYVYSVYF